MKTLVLTTAALILLTFSSKAEDGKPAGNDTKTGSATAAPMLAGNPDEEAPAELKSLLANPLVVPVAPVFTSSPEENAPEELKDILAYPVQVPVAPIAFGSPDEQAPLELGSMPAYAVN